MKTKIYSLLSVLAVAVLFFVGCSKQSYVSVSDFRGIAEGAPVIWYEGDAYVGKVSKVKEADGRFHIYIEFQKSYEKAIHSGVRACPLVEPKISNQPILLLVGGKDATMPVLEPGSQIPEISLDELQRMKQLNFWEWFGGAKMGLTLVLAAVVVVLCIICLLKVVVKLVKFGLFLAIVAIVVFYFLNLTGDWNKYKEDASKHVKEIKIEEIKDWLQKRYSGLKESIPGAMQNIKLLEGIRNGASVPGTPSADQQQPDDSPQPANQ